MKWLVPFLILLALIEATDAQTLNVVDFGARGDAVNTTVNTVSGSSSLVLPSATLSCADAGKVILLFGAGAATSATNQDMVALIVRVTTPTNAVISRPCGITLTGASCTYGTQNASAFQACVNACGAGSTVISIPAGNFLLLSPQAIDTNFVMASSADTYPAVTINKGGLHFLGSGSSTTTLTGNGAWQNKGSYAYRGFMFKLQGPVTNDLPLIFDSLTMDGGVSAGRQTYAGFPARTADGAGWDITHDAIIDRGDHLHAYKSLTNCVLTKWRGEMLKSNTTWTNGFSDIGNCTFFDGNASGYNFTTSHDIHDCTFDQLHQATEFYQAYCATDCSFRNTTVTNMAVVGLVFNGASTNHAMPAYLVGTNSFWMGSVDGIYTTPVDNLSVIGNDFHNGNTAISLGVSGYQGTAVNSNIVVALNTFTSVPFPIQVLGAGANLTRTLTVTSNNVISANNAAYGFGYGTNMVFTSNTGTSAGALNSTLLTGQWYKDDVSNTFLAHDNADFTGVTNLVSYWFGMRHRITSTHAGSVWALDDVHRTQIPSGVSMSVTNNCGSTITLYLSRTNYPSGSSVSLVNGASTTKSWNGTAWQ